MLLSLQFLFAFAILTLLIKYLTRKSLHPLSWAELILVLALKTGMGCLYGWLFLTKYGGDDTWIIHQDTLNEWENLIRHPDQFFIYEMDIRQYVQDMGWKDGLVYFRMKLEKALINKPLGIFNFYSQGNYYINVIAFTFFSFWGSYWLYQILARILPNYKQLSFILLFLYPPALFWLSGIRSDAILFLFFSLFVSRLYLLKYENARKGNWWLVGLAVLGMAIIKASFTILLLIPALAFWLSGSRKPAGSSAKPHARIFGWVFSLAALIFFGSALLPAPFNFPQAVLRVQQEFFELDGNTRIELPALSTAIGSYIRNLPAALDNIFLRPYPWEARGILQFGMVAQNIFILCLIGAVLLRRFPGRAALLPYAFFWLLFSFSISFYLSIGYTIPFPGAVIRYRVIPEMLLVWMLMVGLLNGRKSHYDFFYVYKNRVDS